LSVYDWSENGKSYRIFAGVDDTVDELKFLIVDKSGLNYERHELYYGLKILTDSKRLKDYGIKNNDSIYLRI
jgi:hypothetical protein